MTKDAEQVVEGHNLKEKVPVRGDGPDLDLAAIQRAESALDRLSVNFDSWAADEVQRLGAARDAVLRHGLVGDFAEELFRSAHDLKGEAVTFGYPLVTRICASLCALLEDASDAPDLPIDLINLHVDAVRAIVRDHVKGERHPTAIALVNKLATATNDHIEARRGSVHRPMAEGN